MRELNDGDVLLIPQRDIARVPRGRDVLPDTPCRGSLPALMSQRRGHMNSDDTPPLLVPVAAAMSCVVLMAVLFFIL